MLLLIFTESLTCLIKNKRIVQKCISKTVLRAFIIFLNKYKRQVLKMMNYFRHSTFIKRVQIFIIIEMNEFILYFYSRF